MTRLSKILIAAAATFAAPVSTALAQDAEPAEGEAGAEVGAEGSVDASGTATVDGAPAVDPAATGEGPMPGALPSLTLGAGKILIAGSTINIGLFPDNAGKPFSLAPSVYYGVNEKLTVGLTHDSGTTMWSPRPALRFTTIDILGTPVVAAAGAGICLSGEEGGCPKVYDNVGLDALYGIKDEKFSLAAHPGLDVFSFDPFVLQLRLGVLGRYAASDKLAIVFDPRIAIGITERDFNKERIDVPVWAWYMASAQLGVYLHTGINGPLDGFGDAFAVPVQVGANYMVNEKLTAGADFSFVNLLGKGGDADGKMIGLRAAYAL